MSQSSASKSIFCSHKSTFKILAYITAYEDYPSLIKCINAIQNQSFPVDKIFIVDNSHAQLPILENTGNIIIKHYPENLGIGGGLQKAFDFAYTKEYDFLWTFDQDSVPTSDCLQILINKYQHLTQNEYKIGIIAPHPVDIRTKSSVDVAVFKKFRFVGCDYNTDDDFFECDAPITSGSLISLAAAKTISPLLVDLFIDGIDLDYGMKLKQKGFRNFIVTTAILDHNFGNPTTVKFLQQERNIHLYSPLRYYYICRNHTYLEIRYAQGWNRLLSFLWRIKYMLWTIGRILLYEFQDKPSKVWACLIGTYHGLLGKLGKIW